MKSCGRISCLFFSPQRFIQNSIRGIQTRRACSSILHPFLIIPSLMCIWTPVYVHNLNAGHECPKRFRKRPICSKGRGMCQGRRAYQAAEPEGNTRWPYTVSNRAGNIVA